MDRVPFRGTPGALSEKMSLPRVNSGVVDRVFEAGEAPALKGAPPPGAAAVLPERPPPKSGSRAPLPVPFRQIPVLQKLPVAGEFFQRPRNDAAGLRVVAAVVGRGEAVVQFRHPV